MEYRIIENKKLNQTALKILDVAEEFAKNIGFNSFSYRDIQEILDIKTSTIHYYFPTKLDLAYILFARFIQDFTVKLNELNQLKKTPLQRLNLYNEIFSSDYNDGKHSLYAVFSLGQKNMSEEVVSLLPKFIKLNQDFLQEIFKQAINKKEISKKHKANDLANLYFALLQGALLNSQIDKQKKFSAILADFLNLCKKN